MKKFYHISLDLHFSAFLNKWTAFILFVVCFCFACKKSDKLGKEDVIDQVITPVTINKVLFTDPAKVKLRKENSTEIFDQLVKYFDAAAKGSTVYVNIYLFDYAPILDAIIRTHQRGVNVKVMVDQSRDESIETNVAAIQKLQNVLKGGSTFTTVNNDISSGSSGSINHLKYVLFTELQIKNEGVAKNVVFSTSSNFTASDMKKIQDAVVISHDGFFNAFLTNWNNINKYAVGGMRSLNYQIYNSTDQSLNAFFFPRLQNGVFDGSDTIIDIMDKISDFGNATIQVGMSDWADSRLVTAKKLTELREKGAKVEVFAKTAAGPLVQAELQNLKSKGGYVNILVSPINIHAKFMLIKGKWNGVDAEVIVTGTHNYTTNALKSNNEVIVLMKNSPLFKEYQLYYQRMKDTFK